MAPAFFGPPPNDIKQKPKESEFERNQKTDNTTDIKYGMRKKILS